MPALESRPQAERQRSSDRQHIEMVVSWHPTFLNSQNSGKPEYCKERTVGRRLGSYFIFIAVLASLGCGDSSSSSETANIRVFQGSPDAPHIDVLVDGKAVATNIQYGGNSGYFSVKAGSPNVQIVDRTGAPVLQQTVSIAGSASQTLLLTGRANSIEPVTLADGGTTANGANGHVRVVNASPSLGQADVYLVAPGASIMGAQPITAALDFDKDTGYQLAGGSYEVFLTTPGTKNALLDTAPVSINSGQNQTIVVLDGVSGGFSFSQLIDQ
jgi:hypothetical protein